MQPVLQPTKILGCCLIVEPLRVNRELVEVRERSRQGAPELAHLNSVALLGAGPRRHVRILSAAGRLTFFRRGNRYRPHADRVRGSPPALSLRALGGGARRQGGGGGNLRAGGDRPALRGSLHAPPARRTACRGGRCSRRRQ